MKILQCEQGSPEWFTARMGIPTASELKRIITPTGKFSEQSTKYMYELIAERLAPDAMSQADRVQTHAIKMGIALEPEARKFYELEYNCTITPVGFILNDAGDFGASPDGVILDAKGGLELKCPQPSTHVAYLDDPESLEAAYRPQAHGGLIVTDFDFWDIVSYCPPMPCVRRRVVPDAYTRECRVALAMFQTRLLTLLEKVKAA